MADLVVVIPGIMGSVLEQNGEILWGFKENMWELVLNKIIRNPESIALKLANPGAEADDGVDAIAIMPSMFVVPWLFKTDGYDCLMANLYDRVNLLAPENKNPAKIIDFPYDWRLSNRVSAKRLKAKIDNELKSWRELCPENKNAKVTFICHSMGGLVARYYIECLGGMENTRNLVTIGTPYSGSVDALIKLVNGLPFMFGLGEKLSEAIRTFPSIYELLPVANCVKSEKGAYESHMNLKCWPKEAMPYLENAKAFHDEIRSSINFSDRNYRIKSVKGMGPRTAQSVRVDGEKLIPLYEYKGEDLSGDGTVPRFWAHPSELDNRHDWREGDTIVVPAAHGVLQNHNASALVGATVITEQILSAGITFDYSYDETMGEDFRGMDVPECVVNGEPHTVSAFFKKDDGRKKLTMDFYNVENCKVKTKQLKYNANGVYEALIPKLKEGPYKVKLLETVGRGKTELAEDILVVWGSASGQCI